MAKKKGEGKPKGKRGPGRPPSETAPGGVFRVADQYVFQKVREAAEANDRPLSREIRQAMIAWLRGLGMWTDEDERKCREAR